MKSFNILIDRISAKNKYRIADTGQLCLFPLCISRVLEIHLLFYSRKIWFLYNDFIQFKRIGPNLNFSKVFNKKLHSTECHCSGELMQCLMFDLKGFVVCASSPLCMTHAWSLMQTQVTIQSFGSLV